MMFFGCGVVVSIASVTTVAVDAVAGTHLVSV